MLASPIAHRDAPAPRATAAQLWRDRGAARRVSLTRRAGVVSSLAVGLRSSAAVMESGLAFVPRSFIEGSAICWFLTQIHLEFSELKGAVGTFEEDGAVGHDKHGPAS